MGSATKLGHPERQDTRDGIIPDAESRLRGLIALSTEAIISTDETQRIVLFNRGAEEIFGYTAAEAIGRPLDMLLPRAARAAHRAFVAGMLAGGDASRRMAERTPVRGRRKNGEEFEAQVSIGTLQLETHGVATALVRDVSELRAAETALQRSETRHRTLIDASPAGIFTASVEGTVTGCNPAFAAMLGGTSPADLTGESLRRRFEHPGIWDEIIAPLIASDRYQLGEYAVERLDRVPAHLLIKARLQPAEDGGLDTVHGFVIDVTDRRELEAAARRTEQLDAMGKLAGGIAHDFNNMLSIIRLSASFLRNDPTLSAAGQLDIAEMERVATRASELTRQLLAFGQRQVLRPAPLDLGGVVRRMRELLKRVLGEDILLRLDVPDGPATILADEAQVERILVNLVTNARDAMPRGGTVEVGVKVDEPTPQDRLQSPALGPGPHVRLTVKDSGMGMDDGTKARIFEPFFTTKGHLKGTGLGLASVYGIVAQSRGGIVVNSAPGRGTAFHLWFPRSDETPGAVLRPARPVPARATFVLPLVVLVVEDDSAIRALVQRLLEARGLTVFTTGDATSALQTMELLPGRIDALVSDVVLPGMSGQRLAQHIVERHPDIRVLFMSGYSPQAVEHHGRLLPGSMLIAKPFSPDEFLSQLAELLDRPATR